MIVRGLVRLPRLRLLAPLAVPATGIRWNSCGKSYDGERQEGGGRDNRSPFWGSTAVALGLGAVLLQHTHNGKLVAEEESNGKTTGVLGERKEGLPEFTMEEVGGPGWVINRQTYGIPCILCPTF